MHCEKRSRCACPQGWYICLAFFISLNVSAEYIPTFIDGVKVIEFGDFGKAPNQYPLTVGELNVISSDVVTQRNGKTYFLPKRDTSTDSNKK